jgi:hypothetical protein
MWKFAIIKTLDDSNFKQGVDIGMILMGSFLVLAAFL